MAYYKEWCLQARDLYFRQITATVGELQHVAVTIESFLFYLLAVAAFIAFDNLGVRTHLSLALAVVIWAVAVMVQVTAYVGVAIAWSAVNTRLKLPRLYLPIAGIIAYCLNYSITIAHIGLYSSAPLPAVAAPGSFVTGYLLSLIFEALYFAFVLPLVRPGVLAARAKAMPPRTVTVAGETFAVEDILFVRGQAHYLQIATKEGQYRLRGRLGDLVSQFDDADGILAHRSHWIARRAIAALARGGGGDAIVTTTGERFAVARTRHEAVMAWMEDYAGGAAIYLPPQTNGAARPEPVVGMGNGG